jgi:hypothetical protein
VKVHKCYKIGGTDAEANDSYTDGREIEPEFKKMMALGGLKK